MKLFWENLLGNVGKSTGEIIAGKSCSKFSWENLAGKSCVKILQEIVVGKSCR